MSSPPATATAGMYLCTVSGQGPLSNGRSSVTALQISVYVLSKKGALVCWCAVQGCDGWHEGQQARNPSRLDCMSAAGLPCADWAHQTITPGVPLSAQFNRTVSLFHRVCSFAASPVGLWCLRVPEGAKSA
jgi:hypothetical protein